MSNSKLVSPTVKESKPYYYTKAEIILREDVQDFRKDGMTDEEIIKAFTATLWSLMK